MKLQKCIREFEVARDESESKFAREMAEMAESHRATSEAKLKITTRNLQKQIDEAHASTKNKRADRYRVSADTRIYLRPEGGQGAGARATPQSQWVDQMVAARAGGGAKRKGAFGAGGRKQKRDRKK